MWFTYELEITHKGKYRLRRRLLGIPFGRLFYWTRQDRVSWDFDGRYTTFDSQEEAAKFLKEKVIDTRGLPSGVRKVIKIDVE